MFPGYVAQPSESIVIRTIDIDQLKCLILLKTCRYQQKYLEFHLKLGKRIFFFYREYVYQRQCFGYCGIQINHQHLLQIILTRKIHLKTSVYYNETFFMKLIFTHLLYKSYITEFFGVTMFFIMASSTSISIKFTTNSLRG